MSSNIDCMVIGYNSIYTSCQIIFVFRFGIAPRHRFNFNTRFYPLEEQLKDTSGSDDLVNETEAFLNNPLIYNFPPKSYHQVPRQKSPKIKSHGSNSYYDNIISVSRNIFTTTTTYGSVWSCNRMVSYSSISSASLTRGLLLWKQKAKQID